MGQQITRVRNSEVTTMKKTTKKELSAIEFFKKHYIIPDDLRYVKRNFPTASMSRFYRECPNVALLWTALTASKICNALSYSERLRKLNDALNAFELEFYKAYPHRCIDTADQELDETQLRKWADRLRQYVTPR